MIACVAPYVIDGDTIACANLPAHIRLLAIDAPELPGHCRRGRVCVEGDAVASRDAMIALVARGRIACQPEDYDRYARILARCRAGRVDLSCAMIAIGGAVERYSPLGRCPTPPRNLPRIGQASRAKPL